MVPSVEGDLHEAHACFREASSEETLSAELVGRFVTDAV